MRKLLQLFILVSFLFIASAGAMENRYLASWVKAASYITVTTANAHITVPIQDNTTVFDVKNSLTKQVGADVQFQALRAVWLRPETCFILTGRSEWLQDKQLIKQLMHNLYTDQFELHVLRRIKNS